MRRRGKMWSAFTWTLRVYCLILIVAMNCMCIRVATIPREEPIPEVEHINEWLMEFSDHNDEIIEELPERDKPKRRIVKLLTRIVKIERLNLYATCYSQYDGKVEVKGWYACHWNKVLRRLIAPQEHRIQLWHYTVAIPPERKELHESIIKLPDGRWTFKYRIHVPEYNLKDRPTSGKMTDVVDHGYWSVPRDRMKWKGRIDVLYTGDIGAVRRKQKIWKRKGTKNWPIDVWEIQIWAMFNDGTEERME